MQGRALLKRLAVRVDTVKTYVAARHDVVIAIGAKGSRAKFSDTPHKEAGVN